MSNSFGRSVFAENENHLRYRISAYGQLFPIKYHLKQNIHQKIFENLHQSRNSENPSPKEKYKNTNAKKILKLLEAPPDQDKFKKESPKNTQRFKRRAEDLHEDPIAKKQFCESKRQLRFVYVVALVDLNSW
ncbi:MAG: hypothetical protein CM1200mP30_31830 [Pseudomonadota bacterium]|nr:MAG: hypothetical protein CM1200mP30_31830 [Pseudomonadota bacterium]